jgi:hypothetical protein
MRGGRAVISRRSHKPEFVKEHTGSNPVPATIRSYKEGNQEINYPLNFLRRKNV